MLFFDFAIWRSRNSIASASGTRKEELLLSQAEINRSILLRQFLADMPEAEAIEFLLRQMAKSKNNKEFFTQMAQG